MLEDGTRIFLHLSTLGVLILLVYINPHALPESSPLSNVRFIVLAAPINAPKLMFLVLYYCCCVIGFVSPMHEWWSACVPLPVGLLRRMVVADLCD